MTLSRRGGVILFRPAIGSSIGTGRRGPHSRDESIPARFILLDPPRPAVDPLIRPG